VGFSETASVLLSLYVIEGRILKTIDERQKSAESIDLPR
jgi:hypothetical protein